MTPHFIEVHDGAEPMSVNIEQIEWFADETLQTTHCEIRTIESYDDIKDLIRSAGCQITKADPRLDTAHPIPWEDLVKLEMIGQPVWNSNSRRWMLVIDSGSFRDWIVLLNDAGGQEKWIEHDVQARPLYRMRKEM